MAERKILDLRVFHACYGWHAAWYPAYVHMRDSAWVAARVDNWLTNGDARTYARLLRGVAHVVSFGRLCDESCIKCHANP
jgi:hypothetical protein